MKALDQWGVRELARATGISPTTTSRVKRREGLYDSETQKAVLNATGECLCCGAKRESDMQTINVFDRGRLAYHSSTDGAGPDVGISIGLGGRMIYAGEVPDMPGPWSLTIYTPNGRADIGGPVDKGAAVAMVEAIAAALRTAP